MICDFTILAYSLLAAHILAGTIFVTGGYFLIRRIFAKPGNVLQISDNSFKIPPDPEKQGHTFNRAA